MTKLSLNFNPRAVRELRPSEVIYQIYPSSFNDSNSDGIGDLAGIRERLGYVASLGVDAVWTSPFCVSPEGPEGDGGYAVSDYQSVDPKYGTMADFDALISAMHDHGLKHYLEMVVSHTAHDHDWFERSRNREPGFEDIYVWHPGSVWRDGAVHHDGNFENGERIPPNNWKSVFGGTAWTFDKVRGEYYMHNFLPSQPQLNHNNPVARQMILNEMDALLSRGVDGFRIDALPFATYDPAFRNNPWMEEGVFDGDWGDQYFQHSICQPETLRLVEGIHALLKQHGDKTGLGEVIAGPYGGGGAVDIAADYVNRPNGLDACYTDLGGGLGPSTSHDDMKNIVRMIQQQFPEGGHTISISNHDFHRTRNSVDHLPEHLQEQAHRQNMKIKMTVPGSVILYQGEELGLPQARIPQDIPIDRLKDPVAQTRGPEHCRDGSRTPMVWHDALNNTGFSAADETGLYLPIPSAHKDLAVNRQENDPGSMLNFMKSLIHWRKSQPALVKGRCHVLDTPEPILAFVRHSKDQTVLCCYNRSDQHAKIKPSDYLAPAVMEAVGLPEGQVITLEPYGDHIAGAPMLFEMKRDIAPAKNREGGVQSRQRLG